MKKAKDENNRRGFLKQCSLATIPILLPAIGVNAKPVIQTGYKVQKDRKVNINFIYDGLGLSPQEYIEKLTKINKNNLIEEDYYGNGGATQLLEDEFAKLTGKEKAIYLPTGTMANQLAIKLLNENNTKVIVPENSHIYRDEADAAQSVHNKRLVPIGKNKPYFELEDLKDAIEYINENEAFKSGLGTIMIENPVRRADGVAVPIEIIKEISNYCKQNGYKMHLDGARIHLASSFTDVSLLEYSSYFDTVYISLYKYLNATGGAILCGDSKFIEQIAHQIKILGGTTYQTWSTTSMALHYLDGISERLNKVAETSKELIAELNKIYGLSIKNIKNGTNIFHLNLDSNLSSKKLVEYLFEQHNISLYMNKDASIRFVVNESLLLRDTKEIADAWKLGIEQAHK